MSGVLIYLILIIFVITRLLNAGKMQSKKGGQRKSTTSSSRSGTARRSAGRSPMASDGHRVPKDQDISCRRFGHNHSEFDTPRFIPHEDPEEGYIILNGVKMKLTDADKYENRI